MTSMIGNNNMRHMRPSSPLKVLSGSMNHNSILSLLLTGLCVDWLNPRAMPVPQNHRCSSNEEHDNANRIVEEYLNLQCGGPRQKPSLKLGSASRSTWPNWPYT